nr:STAS-like domain-containing protein [Burkholderia cenocepacia]
MISVASDFSPFAGGRYTSDGPFSGERFREEVLLPHLRRGETLSIDLDGTLGLGSSFLEEAFGGLVRAGFRLADLKRRLTIHCRIKSYEDRTWQYMADAEKKHK